MFRKKKLYKITYQVIANHTIIIEAKDEFQALKKFRKMARKEWFVAPDIISIKEIII